MGNVSIRVLNREDVAESRRLSNENPDVIAAYLLERLPCYYEIADTLEPDEVFFPKQRLMLGAFKGDSMVGTIAVSIVDRLNDLEVDESRWELLQDRFSEHDLNVYSTLCGDWFQTVIGAPDGSLSIHSLCVSHEYRRSGVGTRLIQDVIDRLLDEERSSLFIEVARIRRHLMTCRSLGFQVVQKTLSLSARLRFGYWGVALLQYDQADTPEATQ